MWYPATITVAAASEPITLAEAKAQCSVDADESEFDTLLTRLIASARAFVERYCGVRFASQTVEIKCDSFADFARLPEAPVSEVAAITYTDTAGDEQTLASSVYELRSDGLEASIVLQYNQQWPSIRPGSRIVVTAVVGMTAPDDVKHAMLLFIADAFLNREDSERKNWTAFDALLCNHRRGV